MARRRFFVDQVRKGHAEITGDSAQHLTRVLRIEAGQKFEITDNERAWLASVETARKDLVRFSVIEELAIGPALPDVTLYLALIKFERFEWAVEKATELGAARIIPVEASRSEHGLFAGAQKRAERWRRIAREASEQSRRLRAPEVGEALRLADALKDAATHRCWLDEQPGAEPLITAVQFAAGDSAALLVGPEGGWTEQERLLFPAAGWKAASLGPSILRSETAVCAALGVFLQIWLAEAGRTGSAGIQTRAQL
ncbi:MAG: 16S rRNA (uracil(1498)-N(3))-methyltransferase [Acidobacteriota bacterium]|nr:16S rRNA (uracil(1498)-N(3))-methyltransferase [Acidobacteriota bacterium]